MKLFKKVFMILPAIILVFMLAGCPGEKAPIVDEGPGPSATPVEEIFPSDEVPPDEVTTSDEVSTVEEVEREAELGPPPLPSIKTIMYGGSQEDIANAAAVDGSGNLYVAGSMEGKALLVKYSPQGEKLWSHTLSSGVVKSVIANNGFVYVVGDTTSAFSGCDPACEYKGGRDIFLAKFNAASGAVEFIRQYGSPGFDSASSVTAYMSAIYITGYTDKGSDFCVTSSRCGTSFGLSDVFIINVNNLGIGPFIRTFGTTHGDFGRTIAVDSSGAIYIAGNTAGCLDPAFTPCNEETKSETDAFIAKFITIGVLAPKIKQFGFPRGGMSENVGGMALDKDKNILVGGAVAYEPFLYKFNADFTRVLRRFLILETKELIEGMIVDNEGSAYLVGGTNCTAMLPEYSCDVLVLKYDKDGNAKWVGSFATQDGKDDLAKAAALSPDGKYLYVVGYTFGSFDGIANQGKSDMFILKLDSATGMKQ